MHKVVAHGAHATRSIGALLGAAFLFGGLMPSFALAKLTGAQIRLKMDAYGQCLIRREGQAAREYVLQRGPFPMGKTGDVLDLCLGEIAGNAELRFPGRMLGYLLADALVRRDYSGAMPDVADRDIPKKMRSAPTEEQLKWRADPKNAAIVARVDADIAASDYMTEVAGCMVQTNPRAVHQLLIATPESAEEQARRAAVVAILPKCVTAAQQLQVDMNSLRGSLALQFYRMANAPASVSKVPNA